MVTKTDPRRARSWPRSPICFKARDSRTAPALDDNTTARIASHAFRLLMAWRIMNAPPMHGRWALVFGVGGVSVRARQGRNLPPPTPAQFRAIVSGSPVHGAGILR